MKIELDPNKSMGPFTLRLSHGNEASCWDVSTYYQRSSERTPSLEESMIFDEINAYWAQLSADRQQGIWQAYRQAREILDTHYDITALMGPLKLVVKRLYDLMPITELAHWTRFQNIRLPSNLKEQYDERDIPDQTYLRHDYEGLITLSIALRPMLPIWGEFIGATHKEAGNAFKELQAFKLLKLSTLQQSEPMQRLNTYVTSFIERSPQASVTSTSLLVGLSSSEVPTWLVGMTVVRRLPVGQICSRDDSNLITNVHQFVHYNLKAMDRKIGAQKFGGTGKVVDKKLPEDGSEEKASIVEMYKVKQEVPDGERVILQVFSEDTDISLGG